MGPYVQRQTQDMPPAAVFTGCLRSTHGLLSQWYTDGGQSMTSYKCTRQCIPMSTDSSTIDYLSQINQIFMSWTWVVKNGAQCGGFLKWTYPSPTNHSFIPCSWDFHDIFSIINPPFWSKPWGICHIWTPPFSGYHPGLDTRAASNLQRSTPLASDVLVQRPGRTPKNPSKIIGNHGSLPAIWSQKSTGQIYPKILALAHVFCRREAWYRFFFCSFRVLQWQDTHLHGSFHTFSIWKGNENGGATKQLMFRYI